MRPNLSVSSAWLDQRMSLVNAHKILSFRFRQFGPFIARFGDGLDPGWLAAGRSATFGGCDEI